MRCVRAASILCCVLAGCGDETLLLVQVRTDYEPVVDFDAIEVAVADRVVTEPAAPSEPYRDGVRIAEFEGLIGGPTVVSARLLTGRATVAARNQSVTVSGRTAITIDLTRGCLDCVDGGIVDSGFDAGSRDGGADDAATTDAATLDAGTDAGSSCPGCPADCCEDTCVDFRSDPNNCGECGRSCGVLMMCCGGDCHLATAPSCGGCDACAEGDECCSGSCAETSTDEANCGMCGRVCTADQECMGGACLTSCGGEWVDLLTNRNHCGMCGRRCSPLGGASCTCTGGVCMGLCL